MAKTCTSSQCVSLFAVGLCVGAGAALMLAPMPGRKMQRKIVEKVDDLAVAARRMTS